MLSMVFGVSVINLQLCDGGFIKLPHLRKFLWDKLNSLRLLGFFRSLGVIFVEEDGLEDI